MNFLHQELRVLRNLLRNRIYISPQTRRDIVDSFHKLYYESAKFDSTWYDTTWRGVPVLKCPLDLWIYQEIIHEKKPDIIIETGTFKGGSALYMADICDAVGNGRIITIDIDKKKERPYHRRIEYMLGSSTEIKLDIPSGLKVMVVLDSDHSKEHVANELYIYSKLVTKGQYLIVEDTNINGHPVLPEFGEGPMEALDEFLKVNKDFELDKSREKFLLTFNPRGFLIKK